MSYFPMCDELRSWAHDECVRQSATREIDLQNMLDATMFCFTLNRMAYPAVQLIEKLGIMVDPEKNSGFRSQPVTIAGKVIPVFQFESTLEFFTTLALCGEISAEEWYQEFETLHPFNDGNGRVGAIFYNYLMSRDSDTMLVPPPYIKNPQ